MKRKNRILSLAFCVILLACPLSINASAQAAPYFKSDTNSNLVLANGKAHGMTYVQDYDTGATSNTTLQSYVLKITTYGTSSAPNVCSGNGKLISISLKQKSGNNYFYKITATNSDISGSVGIYANLPRQQGKRLFVVNVETFKQLYPQPKIGSIRTSKQMPKYDFWMWEELDYEQVYTKANGWTDGFAYFDVTDNIQKYEDQFNKYYPGVTDTPLPTTPGQEGEHRYLATLWVYLGGEQISVQHD